MQCYTNACEFLLELQELCEKLNLKAKEEVLDIGSGMGTTAFYMAKVMSIIQRSASHLLVREKGRPRTKRRMRMD
jgi:protein-L-isoaspartate O-methyltransferase